MQEPGSLTDTRGSMAVRPRETQAGRRVVAAVLVALATVVACALCAAPAAAATLTCTLSQSSVVYGAAVTVSGVADPPVAGQEVVVTLAGADVGTVPTGADGAFSLTFTPKRGGDVTARLVADGSLSAPAPLTVTPALTMSHGALIPFLSTRFVLRVTPATYSGPVTVRVYHRSRRVATLRGRCVDGRAVLLVPLRGIEWFGVRFELAPTAELGARAVATRVKLEWRQLAVGSHGPRVRGVLTQLRRLHIRVPGVGDTFTRAVADAVMAFQKTYRLPRTYVMSYDDWRRLDGATLSRPRYSLPFRHLEIDESRQIIMVVRDGVVQGIVPVSTGATGNTPEGSFSILQKRPMSSTYDGTVALPNFMTFYGEMGIHGYPIVPPYPASHGCVREPLWACAWTYAQAFVGERLYLYF
jgi:N-acetylmuramoyl-L-alanine amidase